MNVAEVTDNLRTMLRMNEKRFRIMVERQVQFALLPRVAGPRAALEPPLFELLVLLVEGHEAATPSLTDESWEEWLGCAEAELNHARQDRSAFPKAARAVASAMRELRKHGALPPPKLQSGEISG